MSDMIPLIASVADLPDAIRYAQTRPTARWYVAKQAVALGAADQIPADWRIPLTAATQPGDLSQDARDEAADAGEALPDGSFPIRNTDELDKAVHALGRADDPDRAKRHIIKRARALGALDKLPETWGITASAAELIAEDTDETVELDALVAASARGESEHLGAIWDESLHPRGRDGKWITRGGKIDVYNLSGERKPALQATAVGVHNDPHLGIIITAKVTTPGSFQGTEHRVGDTIQVLPQNVEQAPGARAHLIGIDPGKGRYQATSVGDKHMVVDTHNDGPDPGVVSRHSTPEDAQAHAANLNAPADAAVQQHYGDDRQAADSPFKVGDRVLDQHGYAGRVTGPGYEAAGGAAHNVQWDNPAVARNYPPTALAANLRPHPDGNSLTPNADRLNSDEAHPDDQLGTPSATAPEHTEANNFGFPAQHKVTPVTHADGRAQLHVEDTTQADPRFASTARAYDVGSPELDQARQQANHDYAPDTPARLSVQHADRSGQIETEEWRKNKTGTYDLHQNGRKSGFSNFTRSQVEARGEHTPLDAKGNPLEQAASADGLTEHRTQSGLPDNPRTPEEHQQHAAYHQGEADRAAREVNGVADPATASRFEATERHHRTMQHEHEEAARQASTSAPANAGGDTASSLLSESEDPDTFLADRGGSDQVDNAGILSGVATEFEQAAAHPDTTPEQRAQLADRLEELAGRDAESHSYFDGEALGLSDEETAQAEQEQQQAQERAAAVVAKLRGSGDSVPLPGGPDGGGPSGDDSAGHPYNAINPSPAAQDLLDESEDPDTFLADRQGPDQVSNAAIMTGIADEFDRAGSKPDATAAERAALADRLNSLIDRNAEEHSHLDPDAFGLSDAEAGEADQLHQAGQADAQRVLAKLRGDGSDNKPNDPTEARYQAAHQAVKDAEARGDHLSDDPRDVASHNRLLAIREKAFEATPAGKQQATDQVVAQQAKYEADLPGQLDASRRANAAQADRRAEHQATDAATAPDDRIARMSDSGLKMIAGTKSPHADAAQAELDRRAGGASGAVDYSEADKGMPNDPLARAKAAGDRAKARRADSADATSGDFKVGDRVIWHDRTPERVYGGGPQPGTVTDIRRRGAYTTRTVRLDNGKEVIPTGGLEAVDTGTISDNDTAKVPRTADVEPQKAALRDRAKPRYGVRDGRGPNGEMQHHVIDTQTGHGIVRTFKGKPNAAKHANDLNRAESITSHREAGQASGMDTKTGPELDRIVHDPNASEADRAAANREANARALYGSDLRGPDAAPSSAAEPRKAALRAKLSESQQQRLRDQGQANWNNHVQHQERAETARRKAKGMDENGNATRPISTSIASNQLRVAGHTSQGGQGGGKGFRVARDGDGVHVTFVHDTPEQQDAAIKSATEHFKSLGYDAHPANNGIRISNRGGVTPITAPAAAPPALDTGAPSAAVGDLTDSQRVNRLVTMHGGDRSTWSVTNLRLAAKAGDTQAKDELERRPKA